MSTFEEMYRTAPFSPMQYCQWGGLMQQVQNPYYSPDLIPQPPPLPPEPDKRLLLLDD